MISLLFPQGKSLQYVYQLNDIAYEPVIAPFTFPILKSNQKLQNDLDERKNSIPYVFNRDLNIAKKQKILLSDFFSKVNELRYANWRLEESKRLVYERRYHKQYEKARLEFVSDSTNLSIISEKFYASYPFIQDKEKWKSYLHTNIDPQQLNDLDKDYELILQICRNRWAEGIYDIKIADIVSRQVSINQGTVPDLAIPNSFNDLELAWIKSKKELLSSLLDNENFRNLGYDIMEIRERVFKELVVVQKLGKKSAEENLKLAEEIGLKCITPRIGEVLSRHTMDKQFNTWWEKY